MYRLTPSDFEVLHYHVCRTETIWYNLTRNNPPFDVETYMDYLFTHNWRNSNLKQLRDEFINQYIPNYEPANTH